MDVAEKTERAIDGAMPLQWPARLLKQTVFKHVKFVFRRLRFQQTLAQQPCFMSPQVF